MREWWIGLPLRHRVAVALAAVLISLLAAFWLTVEGVGDPELCPNTESDDQGDCEVD